MSKAPLLIVVLSIACASHVAPVAERPTPQPNVDLQARPVAVMPPPERPPATRDINQVLQSGETFRVIGRARGGLQMLLVLRDCTAPSQCADRLELDELRVPEQRHRCITMNCTREIHDFAEVAELDSAAVLFTALKYVPPPDPADGGEGVYEGRVLQNGLARTLCLWPSSDALEYSIDLRSDGPDSGLRRCETVPPLGSADQLAPMPRHHFELVIYRSYRDRVSVDPPLPSGPSEAEIAQVFDRIEPLLRECKDVPHGEIEITLDVVGWLRKAANIKVEGADGTAAACLIHAISLARFPFTAQVLTITHAIEL